MEKARRLIYFKKHRIHLARPVNSSSTTGTLVAEVTASTHVKRYKPEGSIIRVDKFIKMDEQFAQKGSNQRKKAVENEWFFALVLVAIFPLTICTVILDQSSRCDCKLENTFTIQQRIP